MSGLWSDAAGALFGSDLGQAATWRAGGSGAGVAVHVILGERRVPTELGAVRSATEVVRIDVLPGEVASPARGDTIEVGSAVYEVSEPPRLDLEGSVWTLHCFRRAS